MAKGKVLGFPGMDVPGPNELRPSMNDCQPERGALSYVPTGIRPVHDYGAQTMPAGSVLPHYAPPTASDTSSATRRTSGKPDGPEGSSTALMPPQGKSPIRTTLGVMG